MLCYHCAVFNAAFMFMYSCLDVFVCRDRRMYPQLCSVMYVWTLEEANLDFKVDCHHVHKLLSFVCVTVRRLISRADHHHQEAQLLLW